LLLPEFLYFKMKKFENSDIESLAADLDFQQWVLKPDDASERMWREWVSQKEGRATLLEEARILVLTIREGYPEQLSAETIDMKVGQLMERIESAPQERGNVRWLWQWLRVACVLLAVSGMAWWFLKPASPEKIAMENQEVLRHSLVNGITKTNRGTKDEAVVLSDSSVVILAPGSSISFLPDFNTDRRIVNLTGSAFFEVAHHDNKPFIVFARKTVTRVVGTSFRIDATPRSEEVNVDVRTGKVAVFSSESFDLATLQPLKGHKGVLLTAAQHASFDRPSRANRDETSLPVTQSTMPAMELIFDDTPLTDVFRQIESEYGVDIVFEERLYNNCPITTTFSDETLVEKINSLCQAIGASYQLLDGRIVVTGSGCGNAK
jgi:transmembrane sensor